MEIEHTSEGERMGIPQREKMVQPGVDEWMLSSGQFYASEY
jgi:hypothetical protein